MGITNGPQVAALGAGLGWLDAVAEKAGTDAPGAALSAEMAEIQADVAAQVTPVVGEVVAWALQRFGLSDVTLDADHPFSDASLAGALSQALGVEVASVKDREQLKDGFRRAVTAKVSQQLGVDFSNVFDRDALRLDVLKVCGVKVQEFIPGLALADLSDRAQTVADVSAFASAQLSQALGIDFGDIRSAAGMREAALAWAMPQVQQMVQTEQAQDTGTPYAGKLLMDRKSVLNRAAQRRFRAKWGNLRKYEDLP